MHASIRFGAGIAEKRLTPPRIGAIVAKLFRRADLDVVVKVGARHVEEALRLVGDRAHDVGCEWPVELTAIPAAQSRKTFRPRPRPSPRAALDDERIAPV